MTRSTRLAFVLSAVGAIAFGLIGHVAQATPPGGHSSGHGGFSFGGSFGIPSIPRLNIPLTPHSHSGSVPRTIIPTFPTPHSTYTPNYGRTIIPRIPYVPRNNYTPSTPRYYPPRTRVTPNTNSVPQTTVTPGRNVIPSTTQPAPQVTVTPSTNVLPATPGATPAVQPAANPGADTLIVDITPANVNQITTQLTDQNNARLDDITRQIQDAVDPAIDRLPGADQLTPDDRQRIRDAVAAGDPDAVRQALGNAANSPAGQDLINLATAQQQVDIVRAAIANGTLTGGDLVNLVNALAQAFPQNVQVNININIAQIAVNQQLIIWLGNAVIGINPIPFGPNVPIALIPGLPGGLIIPLGFGPVLIGLGQPGNAIFLGQGNVMQAAGLPAPIGPPVPDATGPVSGGEIILTNVGQDPVNYNLNQQPFTMQPTYQQTLQATTSWLVEFDRGGNNGQARYQLSEGVYEFTPTPKGWELYRKSFQAKLENGNPFDFQYVVDNQRQVLAAGQSHDLAGPLPPVVRFENGAGKNKEKKLEAGAYRVALAADNTLDIYPADSVPSPAAPTEASSTAAATPPAGDVAATTPPAPKASADAPKAPEPATKASLPPGFKLFDPVAPLTGKSKGKKLPEAFSLFGEAAKVAANQ